MKFKILNTFWPALLWTLTIFVLLVIPTSNLERHPLLGIENLDKLVHAFLFGTLVYLWSRWIMAKDKPLTVKRNLFVIFLLACLYGIGMEFYQKYFTVREFELGDILADMVGASIGWWMSRRYLKK